MNPQPQPCLSQQPAAHYFEEDTPRGWHAMRIGSRARLMQATLLAAAAASKTAAAASNKGNRVAPQLRCVSRFALYIKITSAMSTQAPQTPAVATQPLDALCSTASTSDVLKAAVSRAHAAMASDKQPNNRLTANINTCVTLHPSQPARTRSTAWSMVTLYY